MRRKGWGTFSVWTPSLAQGYTIGRGLPTPSLSLRSNWTQHLGPQLLRLSSEDGLLKPLSLKINRACFQKTKANKERVPNEFRRTCCVYPPGLSAEGSARKAHLPVFHWRRKKKKKSLFSYIESCCQRVSLLISNFVHNQSDCDPPWTPSYEASSAISTFPLWPTPGCHVVERRKEEW